MSQTPKKISVVSSIVALIATLFVAQASPASAEGIDAFAKRQAEYTMTRDLNDQNQVTVYAGESISINFDGSLKTASINALASGDVLKFYHGVTVVSGTVSNTYTYGGVNTSAGSSGDGSASPVVATLTGTPSYTNFYGNYNVTATTDVVLAVNPVFKKGDVAYETSDFSNFMISPVKGNHGFGSNSVLAKPSDSQLNYNLPGVCVATSSLTAGDVLTAVSSVTDGTSTDLGTLHAYWTTQTLGSMPYSSGMLTSYTVPTIENVGDVVMVSVDLEIDPVTAGKTYSIHDFKITKNGTAVPLIGCDDSTAGITAAAVGSNVTVTLSTATDLNQMNVSKYMKYSCVAYASSDSSHTTAIGSGIGWSMGMNATSVSCAIRSLPAGTYSIGIRGMTYSYTSNEKFMTGTVTVTGSSKVDPTFPTLATSVKKGKTIKLSFSPTLGSTTKPKTTQGLVATVALASSSVKSYCTITAIKSSTKKITGYTIKGVKTSATACKIKVTLTGNNSYNTKVKTYTVKVVK